MLFPEIKTQRLLLRQLVNADAQAIFLLRSNKEVNHFISRREPDNVDDAKVFIENINEIITNKQGLYWAIVLQESLVLAGTIALWQFSAEDNSAEMGYELHPDHQHKGLMCEALPDVIGYAFKNLMLKKLYAWTHGDNSASIKLLEKNNFKRDSAAEKRYTESGVLKNMLIYFLKNTNH